MKSEFLSIVLQEDINFERLIAKIEKTFKTKFSFKNEKGRYIAKATLNKNEFRLVDKTDRLNSLLCDEHYTLEIKVNITGFFNHIEFEKMLKKRLEKHNIKWEKGVWTNLELFKNKRIIYPYHL